MSPLKKCLLIGVGVAVLAGAMIFGFCAGVAQEDVITLQNDLFYSLRLLKQYPQLNEDKEGVVQGRLYQALEYYKKAKGELLAGWFLRRARRQDTGFDARLKRAKEAIDEMHIVDLKNSTEGHTVVKTGAEWFSNVAIP